MICEKCGNEHDGTYGSGRFCSVKCARAFSTKAKRTEISIKVSKSLGGNGILKQRLRSETCLYCGKKLSTQMAFCSSVHSAKFQQEKIWNDAEKKGIWPATTSGATAKKYLIEKRGRKCEICGIDEWEGQPVPLVLDHIDGNSDNWKIDNLRIICRNCDGLLPTFSGKNAGRGRHTKRMKSKQNRKKNGGSW